MKRILQFLDRIITFSFAKVMAITGLIILFISILWLVFVNKIFIIGIKPIDIEIASKIGGFIGGIIGVFWSGAGVILIYATFNKQKEFNENQAFEQSFHNLMNSYHTIINNTKGRLVIFDDSEKKGRELESFGRDFFSGFLLKFKKTINDKSFIDNILVKKDIHEVIEHHNSGKPNELFPANLSSYIISSKFEPPKEPGLSIELINAMYEYCYEKHQNSLGHYFRFIYNIFKFIIVNKESEEEKRKYISLIQAHMSNDELGVLFYNGLSKFSKNKEGLHQFKKWMETYNFFENMDKSCLLCINDSKFYNTEYKYFTR
ncbi:MAG: putative phage abortive infection protein [Bacteroidales bacterium]|jgi:hypothetical protein|nr:putative phage abortive infection protein [Bacteroidales bacterium]